MIVLWHALVDGALIASALRKARRPNRIRYIRSCLKCGYDLYGLPDPICPECGTRGYVGWSEDPHR